MSPCRHVVAAQISRETLPVAVAALGALVMPYNVFFQSSVINARPRDTGSSSKKATLLRYMRLEAMLVLVLAFVVNLFVICVFADGFYGVLSEDEVRLLLIALRTCAW
jgi:natural resistance-associated macrophage protein